MNRAAVLQLAGMIASRRFSFNMGTFGSKIKAMDKERSRDPEAPVCGTAGCIAGHGAVLWNSRTDYNELLPMDGKKGHAYADQARVTQHLGITYREADQLFFGNGMGLRQINRCMAVGALQRLASGKGIKFDHSDREGLRLLPEVRAWAEWFDRTPESITAQGCSRAPEDVPPLADPELALTPEFLTQ